DAVAQPAPTRPSRRTAAIDRKRISRCLMTRDSTTGASRAGIGPRSHGRAARSGGRRRSVCYGTRPRRSVGANAMARHRGAAGMLLAWSAAAPTGPRRPRGDELSRLGRPGFEGEGSAVRQEIAAHAGDTLSFDAYYVTTETHDNAFFTLVPADGGAKTL